jgi:hypothetical protein
LGNCSGRHHSNLAHLHIHVRSPNPTLARGAGIEHAYTARTLAEFGQQCRQGLKAHSPYVLVAKVDKTAANDIKRKHSDGREDKYIFVRHVRQNVANEIWRDYAGDA